MTTSNVLRRTYEPRLPVIAADAPEVYASLVGAWAASAAALDDGTLAAIQRRVEAILTAAPGTDIGPAESPEAAFVDQFVDYVADVDDALRAPLAAKYGKSLRNFVEAVYIIDQSVRLGLTHARLFPAVDADFEAVPEPAEILPPTRANMKWHDEILAHGVMDDLMREVVRLRGSWYHDCDLCNSCRLVDGQTVVVDADLEARIHTYREGTMSPAHTAALAYADAYMVDPAAMPEELADELRSRFTRAELLALTLEMSSWNYQKVLVALAIDHPVSTEGFTAITVGSDGALQIGELLRS